MVFVFEVEEFFVNFFGLYLSCVEKVEVDFVWVCWYVVDYVEYEIEFVGKFKVVEFVIDDIVVYFDVVDIDGL